MRLLTKEEHSKLIKAMLKEINNWDGPEKETYDLIFEYIITWHQTKQHIIVTPNLIDAAKHIGVELNLQN